MGATKFKLPSKFWLLVARDEGTLGDIFPLFKFGDPGDKQLKFELSLNIWLGICLAFSSWAGVLLSDKLGEFEGELPEDDLRSVYLDKKV